MMSAFFHFQHTYTFTFNFLKYEGGGQLDPSEKTVLKKPSLIRVIRVKVSYIKGSFWVQLMKLLKK